MLAKGKLGNLVGGISQQQPQLRLPTQSDDEVNTWPIIVDGNVKRPPTEFLGTLPAKLSDDAFTHFINRDVDERYAVSISGGSIQVTDLSGVVKTVTIPDGSASYLTTPTGTRENDNFVAVTVEDYTFIVNKSVVAAMTADVFPTRPPEALINIMSGNYGRTYSASVSPTSGSGFNTATTTNNGGTATDVLSTNTSTIATLIASGLNTNSGGIANGWTFTTLAGVVYAKNIAGIDFNVSCDDGQTNHAMVAIKGQTQDFSKLPTVCPVNGFVVAITGDTQSPNQVYYVQWNTTSTTQMPTSGSQITGVWKECPQPGVHTTFDAATMPHILVRNADGTFTFSKASWNTRVAGDETTIPKPSFIGQAINAVDFHDNRLVFYAGQNAVTSRAGDFFNFWRTSAIELEDDDPIDLNASTSSVATLRAGTPYQGSMLVWADQTQFSLSAGNNELLTPKTASLKDVTPYENLSGSIRPVATPRRVFFAVDRNSSVGIKEWYYDVFYHIGNADDCTAHVPVLLPAGAFRMVNSTIEDVLVVSSRGDRSSLWVYKYFWQGQDKLQSAWVRWNFPSAVILNTAFINSELYLLINRGTQTSLEKMRLYPDLKDLS